MTGFAASHGEVDGLDWRWDLRSVNGRGLDIRVRLPQGFEDVEQPTRELIQRWVRRGSCQVSLQARHLALGSEITVNEVALNRVLALIERIRAETGAEAPRADGILALKGVIDVAEASESDERHAARVKEILAGLERALTGLNEARGREGAKLCDTISGQVDEIARLCAKIAASPARSREAQLERLRTQVTRLLDTGFELSAERLYQEAALIATKVDIQEELDRLMAHVDAARALIGSAEPAGRRLDFLAQEFNREANTICSKSIDIETTRHGLELKAVIDQFREQVQNVE